MSVECKGKNCCMVGCNSYFHKINTTTPIGGFIKNKSGTDYCRELRNYAGKVYGIGSPPYRLTSGKGNKTDRAAVLQSLDIVAKTMHNDLVKAKQNKDYLTDENAKRLKQAAKSLRSAGLTGYHLEREIDELAWFVGGDPSKIMQLQHKLNQLNISGKSGRLKEDGVYGQETWSALADFMSNLEHGVVPALTWTNPLESNVSLEIGNSIEGFNNTIQSSDIFDPVTYNKVNFLEKRQYFRVDAPHPKRNSAISGEAIVAKCSL